MKMFIAVLGACSWLTVSFLIAGCDTEPANQAEINVSPPTARVAFGQSQTFSASGWFAYEWSLEHPEFGYLSQQSGDNTIYTSRVTTNAAGTNTVQILHCRGAARSTVTGSDTNTQQSVTRPPQTDVYITLL
jgi:hypothetical protein